MDWSLSSYDNLKIKISPENAQQYVALQEGFIGDRILDARIFGVAKTEWERAFTMLSHDKNNLRCKSKLESLTRISNH